jgi:flagella basal body P-ring formation protein FlgA
MKTSAAALLLCLLSAVAWAGPAETAMENLIAEAWMPHIVRVEWTFNMPTPAALVNSADWTLTETRPARLAGSMILTLERKHAAPATRITVSGTARIYGNAWTVTRTVPAGQSIRENDLEMVNSEWTTLIGAPASAADWKANPVAAHMLIPGRPLARRDLRPLALVHRGDLVNMTYHEESVYVTLAGKAMQDGASGDTIDVTVDLGRARRFKGAVDENGLVQLIRQR